MQVKLLEVRDRNTFIPCIAIGINSDDEAHPQDRFLVRRAGYGNCTTILFGRLDGGEFSYDCYDQPESPRTMRAAHYFIQELWDELKSGDVVDVEFLAGETKVRKESEFQFTL